MNFLPVLGRIAEALVLLALGATGLVFLVAYVAWLIRRFLIK